MIDPETFRILRDFAVLFVGAFIFLWSLRGTFEFIRPLIKPGFNLLRDKFLEEHTKEEEAKIEGLRTELELHQRKKVHSETD